MSKGVYLSMGSSDWAYLYNLPGSEDLGDRQGKYSAEDKEGRPYICFPIGHNRKTGAPQFLREEVERGFISSTYGTRVFIWAREETEDGVRYMEWDELYPYALLVGFCGRGFWDEVVVYPGPTSSGKPVFHGALRGKTEFAISWWYHAKQAKEIAAAAGWEVLQERHHPYPFGHSVDYMELYKEFP